MKKEIIQAACPRCRGSRNHIETNWDLYCKKCWDKNWVTLRKAFLKHKHDYEKNNKASFNNEK